MNYVHGIDVSTWQGMMDWQKARNAGARFAFIRAGSINNSSGVCYEDFQFERNADIAPDFMPVGFYFYFRPNHDAYKQAHFFADLIEHEDYELPPVCDIEDPGGESPVYIAKRLKQFAETISKRLKTEIMIYTSPGFANPFLGVPEWLGGISLWVAHWTTKENPLLPIAWNSWLFWQYSGDGNGKGFEYGAQSRAIDLNRFNGDSEDFGAFIGGEIIPDPPAPPAEFPKLVKVTADVLNLRRTAGVANDNWVGRTYKNIPFVVEEEENGFYSSKVWFSKDWVKDA